jgi:exonuclease VII small subunit
MSDERIIFELEQGNLRLNKAIEVFSMAFSILSH